MLAALVCMHTRAMGGNGIAGNLDTLNSFGSHGSSVKHRILEKEKEENIGIGLPSINFSIVKIA